MTATKTRTGTGAVALIAAAVIVALVLQMPSLKKGDDFEAVTLSAVFKNEQLDNEVRITYSVNGKTTGPIVAAISPWNRTLTVKKGVRVLLSVTQTQGGDLNCMIAVAGSSAFLDTNHREDAGTIRCYYPERWNEQR